MFQNVRTRRWWVYALIVALGVMLGSQVAATAPLTATAEGQVDMAVSNQGLAATTETYLLTPSNVGVFSNRIHIKATAANHGIWYFAAPTTNPQFANRLLSLFLTAQAAGKRISVTYVPSDTSGAAWGCAAGDCRTVLWAYMVD